MNQRTVPTTLRRLVLLGLAVLTAAVWLPGSPRVALRAQGAPGPCDPPNNAIVCENSKTGNLPSEWDVDGAGDPSIQGFATDISAAPGDTVHFKVDTSASAFRLDIYRLGYYAGRGARKVAAGGPTVAPPPPAFIE
jgi:hypothetical protein